MGDKMDYSVALDEVPKAEGQARRGRWPSRGWPPPNAHGIPTAFVVKDRKIAWIGHPMKPRPAARRGLSETFNIETAASKYREEKALDRKLTGVWAKVSGLMQNQKPKEALAALGEAIADEPKLEAKLGPIKFVLLVQQKETEAADGVRRPARRDCPQGQRECPQ